MRPTKARTLRADEYQEKITQWLQDGKRKKSTHMIVAYDVLKNNPFPVYVNGDTSVQHKVKAFNDNEYVHAIEVYNFNMDLPSQVAQARTWNV